MKHKITFSESSSYDTMGYLPTSLSCKCGDSIDLYHDFEEETQKQFRSFINKHMEGINNEKR